MDKVLFTRNIEMVPMRKGVYKDIKKDFTGFSLYVPKTEPKDGVAKASDTILRPHKPRAWGDDYEFDAVMENFGLTRGAPGEEIEQQLVFGWANVSIQEDGTTPFDWQGDVIEPEVLEAAAYNFVLKHGLTNQEHMWGTECGWLVESMMFTKEKMAALGIPEGAVPEGWFVGFYIPDPVVYKKVKNGEYNMFSIEGRAVRAPMQINSYDQY